MKIEKPNYDCEITAAVGFVSPQSQQDSFVMQQNQKKGGWDIPGGHLDAGETPLDAFTREVFEEVNATIVPDQCWEVARLSFGDGTGISVFDARCRDGEYSAINQVESDGGISHVEVIHHSKAAEMYFGDNEVFQALINLVMASRKDRLPADSHE